MARKVAFNTLGCKVNQYETLSIKNLFLQKGYEVTEFNRPADIYVINTCTVTHTGDRKSRQLIRRAARRNPEAVVVVTGCYAQTSPGEVLNMSEVDLVIGTEDRSNIVELAEKAFYEKEPLNVVTDIMAAGEYEELPATLDQSRIRGFLKIQEGCNNFCSYCIVPYARGPARSRRLEDIMKEARALVDYGYKEIVLTGVHIGAFKDDAGSVSLAGVIEEMSRLEDLQRLRLSSIEPQDIDRYFIDKLASSEKVCRHLHLPLQSGDDQVLEKMKRNYSTAQYRDIVERAREKMPGISITTDVMVGFPGETEEMFNNTVNFIKDIGFSGLHVFKYSQRRGTEAASFKGQVREEEKDRRAGILIELGRDLRRNFMKGFIGTSLSVLVEQCRETNGENLYEGFTGNYIKMVFPAKNIQRGDIVNVTGEEVADSFLKGRIF